MARNLQAKGNFLITIENALIVAKTNHIVENYFKKHGFPPKPKVDSLVNNASQAESEKLGGSQPVVLSVQSVILASPLMSANLFLVCFKSPICRIQMPLQLMFPLLIT
jgi:hypothetical protein